MTTDNFCFYLQKRLIQTDQSGGELYIDTSPFKWCLHRRENITCCRCHQRWRFEKMGGFLVKLHRSTKSLDTNRICEQTLSVPWRHQRKFFCVKFLFCRQVATLIASDTITVPSEEKVYESVISWVRQNPQERGKHLAKLMEHVRLPLLTRLDLGTNFCNTYPNNG